MKRIKNKSIIEYFIRNIGKVNYWKKFQYGKKLYIMTFEYNLYELE